MKILCQLVGYWLAHLVSFVSAVWRVDRIPIS